MFNLAQACPAWVAYVDEKPNLGNEKNRWYAAATRVRGRGVPAATCDSKRILLFMPRPIPYAQKADANMPNLTARISFDLPLPPAPTEPTRNLVIVSDSSLELPGVIYGLQRRAAKIETPPLRLLWIAVCPGAGAAKLAQAWTQAPQCHYGLTVVNMNDCLKGSVYDFTEENRVDLRTLIRQAKGVCTERSDLFINHSAFYPKLDPEYAKLVPLYTQAAKDAGVEVHDGAESVGSIKLRDTMHFAKESTSEVVQMYMTAVQSMLDVPPPRDAEAEAADDPMAVDPEIALSDDDDGDPPADPEDVFPRPQPEPLQSAKEVRERLLEEFHRWNDGLENQRRVPDCLETTEWLLPTRMPASLPDGDDRFHAEKNESLSATQICAERSFAFRLRDRERFAIVRTASSRARSPVMTGKICRPGSDGRRGTSD